MVSISLIVVFSLVLFAYWFRYSCLLILQTRSKGAEAEQNAGAIDGLSASGLSFESVQASLRSSGGGTATLDQLNRDLLNDYRILSFLLRHSSDMGVDPIEQRMLLLDYRLMQLWYQLTRKISPPQARRALDEMSNIMGFFAQSLESRGVRHSV